MAQLSIELGGSTKKVERRLENAGYSEIQITKSGFTSVRAQACFEGSRYVVKINRFNGRIRRSTKIGECRSVLAPGDIIAMLRDDGYRRISIEGDNGEVYRVIACDRGRHFRIRINQYGDTLGKRNLGRCRKRLDVAEIQQWLRENKFNRLKLVRRDNRRIVFEACHGRNRLRLRVAIDGRIIRQRRIGSCTPPINHWNIPGILEEKGFDCITVVDKKLPVYRAEACRRLRLIEVRMNRFGDILKETRVGDCDPSMNKKQVIDLIRQSGANRIHVHVDSSGAFVATSCYRRDKVRSRFDKYGKLFDRDVIGKCPPPPHLGKVLRNFEEKNFSDLQIYIEGCRKGRRIRFEIDHIGEIISRNRIGRCN